MKKMPFAGDTVGWAVVNMLSRPHAQTLVAQKVSKPNSYLHHLATQGSTSKLF
jgi:hypothetical protein